MPLSFGEGQGVRFCVSPENKKRNCEIMPYHVTIIHAREFMQVTAEGTLNYEETKRQLLQCASLAISQSDSGVLIDTRAAHSVLSETNLWYLAAEFGKQLSLAGFKIAVLCPRERFDHAKFLELCSQNRGLNVMAFTSFEEAITWLFATSEVS
ncbi:hypothetical protein U14_04291 [Candidatus Moduliflexus flocculans]|uniref:DUF4180 domain-containing protein n=1 Tax=Candidatus Moduliflexus flocculans TaxID=1499966 RepID=A0A0S6W084_9BACT|nr:hypothetical protein U14_04291 [Candidatus Moduliflexus flocculans]